MTPRNPRISIAGSAVAKEREDGRAVHHRRLEEEAAAPGRGQIGQFGIGMHDRPLVRADDMGADLQRGANVSDGRLAGFGVQRTGFEHDVGLGGMHPTARVANRPAFREIAGQQFVRRESVQSTSQPRRRDATPVMCQPIP